VVLALYDALSTRDVATVHQIVAADLEWWFHGPPSHQFLMRLLTGTATDSASSFSFIPQSITSFGPTVLVEGCDRACSISWVHAWTVSDGVITQLREYFNTSLTVTRLGNSNPSSPSSSDYESTSSASSSKAEITPLHCPSLWESSVSSWVGKSLPGLVLAI
jgi:ketosteroid isomerase-like protein